MKAKKAVTVSFVSDKQSLPEPKSAMLSKENTEAFKK